MSDDNKKINWGFNEKNSPEQTKAFKWAFTILAVIVVIFLFPSIDCNSIDEDKFLKYEKEYREYEREYDEVLIINEKITDNFLENNCGKNTWTEDFNNCVQEIMNPVGIGVGGREIMSKDYNRLNDLLHKSPIPPILERRDKIDYCKWNKAKYRSDYSCKNVGININDFMD